ncbi:MAG: hypothetical protein WBE03_09820 [Terracidiphilus sp.]
MSLMIPAFLVCLGFFARDCTPGARRESNDFLRACTKLLEPTAPRLCIQSMAVCLNCHHDLADKAIQVINWSRLRALLAH